MGPISLVESLAHVGPLFPVAEHTLCKSIGLSTCPDPHDADRVLCATIGPLLQRHRLRFKGYPCHPGHRQRNARATPPTMKPYRLTHRRNPPAQREAGSYVGRRNPGTAE